MKFNFENHVSQVNSMTCFSVSLLYLHFPKKPYFYGEVTLPSYNLLTFFSISFLYLTNLTTASCNYW